MLILKLTGRTNSFGYKLIQTRCNYKFRAVGLWDLEREIFTKHLFLFDQAQTIAYVNEFFLF